MKEVPEIELHLCEILGFDPTGLGEPALSRSVGGYLIARQFCCDRQGD